jgi:sRNA-binding carbon storage regulator CsrA
MLVLTRRPQQKFMITTPQGDVLTFQIIQTRSQDTRIGIDAPEGYHIDRGEIHEQYKEIRKYLKENPIADT